jgi:hypothetical protein
MARSDIHLTMAMTSTILHGTVNRLFIGNTPGSIVATRVPAITLTLDGIDGDRHQRPTMKADPALTSYPEGTEVRNTRQVTIIADEELRHIAATLDIPALDADWLGVNMVLAGVPAVTLLPPGSRLYFADGTGLVVQGENMPCTGPGKVIEANHPGRKGIASRFPKAALHRRGLLAWVEHPGRIAEGDAVRVEFPDPVPYPG